MCAISSAPVATKPFSLVSCVRSAIRSDRLNRPTAFVNRGERPNRALVQTRAPAAIYRRITPLTGDEHGASVSHHRSEISTPPLAQCSRSYSSITTVVPSLSAPQVSTIAAVNAPTSARFCSVERPESIFTLIKGTSHSPV